MMRDGEPYDLVVIGAGMGGLAAASLARLRGLRTALLEAHTGLGGCAGYFARGPYTFDAGATALMGLAPGEPIGDLLRLLGVDFRAVRTTSYRVVLPDRAVEIPSDPAAFEPSMARAFPEGGEALRRFWRWQAGAGESLFRAAGRIPRFPVRGLGDLAHDLRILGGRGLLAASTTALTVADVLRLLRLDRDRAFRALIAMLLQDTAQAGPEAVPFSVASACLQAYRRGMSRPVGGMRALAEGIAGGFTALGGDLRTATLVDRVAPAEGGGFAVETRRRDRLIARQVAFNLPLDRAAALLGRDLRGVLARLERKSRAAWSAFTGYLAVERGAIDDEGPLFHQVLQDLDRPPHEGNNVLISLSPPGDPGYGPPEARVVTMSTHTRPDLWAGLDRPSYDARKAEYRDRLLAALARALPEAPSRILHAEFATPRSFARYTRRALGAVGGPPVSRWNSGPFAVGPDVLGPGLWVVGDSVFPGQGTMATVVSAIRVVERIAGASWDEMRAGLAPLEGPRTLGRPPVPLDVSPR